MAVWLDVMPTPLRVLLLLLPASAFLLASMTRNVVPYDEGLILASAIRVADGELPHRDFYMPYGPAQLYVLAGLFKLLGASVLVERMWDLLVKALIVVICHAIVRQMAGAMQALLAAGLVIVPLAAIGLHGYPVWPTLLFALASTLSILRAFSIEKADAPNTGALYLAGVYTGVVALFRYDVGFLVCAGLSFVLLVTVVRGSSAGRLGRIWNVLLPYGAGVSLVFLPWAVLFLSNAPISDFVHDIIMVPLFEYPRMRALPFPGLFQSLGSLSELGNLWVYLPPLIWGATLVSLVGRRLDSVSGPALVDRPWVLGVILVLAIALYAKGLVRMSPAHTMMGIIASLLLLAAQMPPIGWRPPALASRVCVTVLAVPFTFSLLTIAVHQMIPNSIWLARGHAWNVGGVSADDGPIPWQSRSCRIEPGLERLTCFSIRPEVIAAIRYIQAHTVPSEVIFSGNKRHDRIVANDVLFYFLSNRPAVTKWQMFDPGVQTRREEQEEMVTEFRHRTPRYIVLQSTWDNIIEPNASAVSSGVTILDDYLHATYRPVAKFGAITILRLRSMD